MTPENSPESGRNAAPSAFGRFLAAYRGGLTRAEAARRSGLADMRWEEVESSDSTGTAPPPHTVAAMCAAVRADIATGLRLAGYDPGTYEYLCADPPRLKHLSPRLAPRIANYRAIGDVLASPSEDPRAPIGQIYRETAATNQQLAEEVSQDPPEEGRQEFWEGYATALRALAEEQLRMAHQESPAV